MAELNLSLIDLKALSEPVCKLIDTVSSAVGIMYEPRRIRRKAKAEAEAAIIIAEAESQTREIGSRASERIRNRELRRQRNIESIVQSAVEEMQSLWAKMLAGEVAQPGSYSLRTLGIIKVMAKDDATIFTNFCRYVCRSGNILLHIRTDHTEELLNSREAHFTAISYLQSIGLIFLQSHLNLSIGQSMELSYFDQKFSVSYELSENAHDMTREFYSSASFPFYGLSIAAHELFSISGAQPDEDYRRALLTPWKQNIVVKPI